jgi:hypothetical protein
MATKLEKVVATRLQGWIAKQDARLGDDPIIASVDLDGVFITMKGEDVIPGTEKMLQKLMDVFPVVVIASKKKPPVQSSRVSMIEDKLPLTSDKPFSFLIENFEDKVSKKPAPPIEIEGKTPEIPYHYFLSQKFNEADLDLLKKFKSNVSTNITKADVKRNQLSVIFKRWANVFDGLETKHIVHFDDNEFINHDLKIDGFRTVHVDGDYGLQERHLDGFDEVPENFNSMNDWIKQFRSAIQESVVSSGKIIRDDEIRHYLNKFKGDIEATARMILKLRLS